MSIEEELTFYATLVKHLIRKHYNGSFEITGDEFIQADSNRFGTLTQFENGTLKVRIIESSPGVSAIQ